MVLVHETFKVIFCNFWPREEWQNMYAVDDVADIVLDSPFCATKSGVYEVALLFPSGSSVAFSVVPKSGGCNSSREEILAVRTAVVLALQGLRMNVYSLSSYR
ncbi:hypothetical protein Ancab_006974 [Ancistrocladus abbreviatus]